MFVAYLSYRICRRFHLDYVSAARGALLHDLYLYDWHEKDSHQAPHGVTHPKVALENAEKICKLNELERDIIERHMWPLTSARPSYKESFLVSCADKLCATVEALRLYRRFQIGSRLNLSAEA